MPLTISPLTPADRPRWELLARGYKAFYKTPTSDAEYDTAWQRLLAGEQVHGLGAHLDGELVGIVHYLFHAATWSADVYYLQDLFTDPERRGAGVARALIEAVAGEARQRGAARLYWLTQDHNTVARTLYDKVAQYKGFLRYDYALG